MELKILILDDEYIILDGLCSFPWEMYGCRIVGKAMDGEEGMELIDRYQKRSTRFSEKIWWISFLLFQNMFYRYAIL